MSDLSHHGLMNIPIGWSIVSKKMQLFVYVATYSGQKMRVLLLAKALDTGRIKKHYMIMLVAGGINSPHNIARQSCEDLLNQNQSITTVLHNHTDQKKYQYQKQLEASIDCARFLLRQRLPFHGHDESEESKNRGNFIELFKWLGDNNEEIKAIILDNSPGNEKMIAPDIQKDMENPISFEIISSITKEIGDGLFSILVDESRDISSKGKMAIVLCYVKDGCVIESFVGIEHVSSTTALSLKAAIDDFFSRHGLSISKVRGQGYDGESNMQGEYNGLKTLILNENSSAYSVHCFAHKLQLAVVVVAKKHTYVEDLFLLVTNIVTVVGGSAKRQNMIREKQAALVYEAIDRGELSTGQGLNQETSLKRAGDTRWISLQNTLISMTNMFSAVVDVFDTLTHDSDKKFEARVLRDSIQTYSFVFSLHLRENIMGITADLSQAMQRKDQDIVNAMKLVTICKQRLQKMREDGWESLLLQVSSFCEKHEIEVLNMEDMFCFPGKSKRLAPHITNLHHYRVEFFYEVIDMQLLELNYRFSETDTELLLCVASLNPIDSFSAFDKQNLVRLAQLYPNDFTAVEVGILEDQLKTYIMDMRSSDEFFGLKSIVDIAKRMVDKKKRSSVPIGLFAFDVSVALTSCYCYRRKSIFWHENCEDSANQSNGR